MIENSPLTALKVLYEMNDLQFCTTMLAADEQCVQTNISLFSFAIDSIPGDTFVIY